jgi:MFS family permease
MSDVLAIAAREIRERKLVFLAAAIMAAISALAPLMPGTHSYRRGDILIISGAAWAVAFAAALAIAFGGGIVGGQLRSGRMSFYFSKPLGAGAIWFGKVIGALTTIAAAAVIVLIPALVFGGRAWEMRIDKPLWLLMITAGSAVLLFLISHVVSTLIASRSPLVLVDLAIVLTTTATLYFVIRPLALARASFSVNFIIASVLSALIAAILGAGVRQLARGRSDARRNHVELSRVLWPLVIVIVIAAASYGKWVRTVTPKNLVWSTFLQSPNGQWLVLTGQRRYTDYVGSVVMDIGTRQVRQVEARDVVFSRDGRTTAWLQPAGNSYHVVTGVLDDPSVLNETGISLAVFAQMVLSDDGKRIAVAAGQTLFVQDIASKRLVGSVNLRQNAQRVRMFFENPDQLRVYTFEKHGDGLHIEASRFTPAGRKLESLGRYVTDAERVTMIADQAGSQLLLREAWGATENETREKRQLMDAVTLRPVLMSLPVGPSQFLSALFLSNSNMAFVDKAGEGRTLKVVSPSGDLIHEYPLVENGSATLGVELGKDRLLIMVGRGPLEKRRYSTEVINLSNGRVERREPDTYAIVTHYGWGTDPRPMPRQPSAALVLMERGQDRPWRRIWRWNPSTGERTPLVN